MGYLLTKKAADSNDKGSIDLGKLLGGGVAVGGLTGSGVIGNSILQKKLFTDSNFSNAVRDDANKIGEKLIKMTGGDKGWLAKRLWKTVPGEINVVPTALAKTLGRGATFGAGFKNLKLPGKLKALGLLAVPLAGGGIYDAAID